MIDIVKAVQQADPSLGTYVVVLRADARALDGPERLTPDAQAWIDANAPGGRLARVRVLLAPYPGAMPAERDVTVAAFADARQLAAFATTWTGDPLPEAEEP
ncbi:hypothetical protein [Methylobacterium brachiatum]|uniref:Uncharacterized protein n=1 Tax=Methylobacterium brachiatum TaxID=269660 RepID=A0AAJ1TXI0_9HYPH|nr:hypothetical protein [Methylobacterium brachiatum]MCB4805344.1 hypothetical protein [Methylobacterium brachiatum]MDH2310035.1 hypothetical protein [Methylobacterium brachiatum]MDQ0546529.1 hypothetical protein [Methylobacterium brachiatum]